MRITQNSDGTPIQPVQVPLVAPVDNPAFAQAQVNRTPAAAAVNGAVAPVAPDLVTGPGVAPLANPGATLSAPNVAQPNIPELPLGAVRRALSPQEIVAMSQKNYKEPGNWASAFSQGWSNAQGVSAADNRERQDLIDKQTEAARIKQRQVDYLRANAPTYADAVEAGVLDAPTAFSQFKKDRAGGEKEFQKLEDGTYGYWDKSTGQFTALGSSPKSVEPMSAIGKLAADYKSGRIDEEQYKAGMADIAPKGWTVESDGQGGFRMTQGPADGMPKLNVEEGKNTGFLLRAQDADKTISGLEGQGTSAWNKAAGAIPGGWGNYLLSDEGQQYDQARRDFVNAVLRQESGAVISPEEFSNAEKQYFPQPGDSKKVIEQKAHNRQNAIQGFRIRSGPGAAALDKQAPAQTEAPAAAAPSANGGPVTIKTVEDFQNLQPGTVYIDPNGKQRTKR